MYSVLCPHCHFVNPAESTYCRNCSTAFGLDPEQRGRDLVGTAWPGGRREGLRSRAAPTPEALPRRRATDLEPASDLPPPAAAAPLNLIDPVALPPAGDDAQRPPADLTLPTAWGDLPAPTPIGTVASDDALPVLVERRTVTKSMARQAARRARMAAMMADAVGPPPADVLVLDSDDGTRAELVRLLGRFGFHVHEALDVYQAEQLADAAPYAAAFLDIRLDESDGGVGVALCERLHRPLRGGPATAVVLMSPRLRPADRVRAALARSDAVLAKPLSRGDVARTLESCGVALPADERRH